MLLLQLFWSGERSVRQGNSREMTTTNTMQNLSPLFFPGAFSRFASFKIPNPLVLKRFPLPVLPFYMMQLSLPEVKCLGFHWLLWWFGTASANLNYTAWHNGILSWLCSAWNGSTRWRRNLTNLEKPVDSEALNDSLLVDLLGKYISLVISWQSWCHHHFTKPMTTTGLILQ